MKLRSIRFTLRELMLTVAVSAVLCGVYYSYFVGPMVIEGKTASAISDLGGRVSKVDNHPAWLKRILRGQDQARVVIVHLEDAGISDSDISLLKDFPKLGGLYLNRTPITNEALKTIDEMNELQDLDLSGTKIASARLAGLPKLQQLNLSGAPVQSIRLSGIDELQVLELSDTQVDDADIDGFIGCQKLRTLKLQNTKITDAGLIRLKAMPGLRSIWTKGSQITQDGVNQLRELRPDITVFTW